MPCAQGWRLIELESLPVGVALPLREALHRCRADPPPGTATCLEAQIMCSSGGVLPLSQTLPGVWTQQETDSHFL